MPDLPESVAGGLQVSYGQSCKGNHAEKIGEFCEVLALLESGDIGLQASFGQLCKGNQTGSKSDLEGA